MAEKIGKYQIVERIGRGGMGTIFKAHDPALDRLVALKVISTEVEVTDELRARFFREAQACARLSHPNIVTVYAMGDEDGQLYIVMELLEGQELKHLIAERKALALEDKLSIMIQVCEGLHYAHQNGIVHRDIKPGNIFLVSGGQVKILDFGIAQMASAEGSLTRTGLIMGSLRYISPEQVRGRVDHRSDIFSVGAVFYELLTMRPPFTGEDPMVLLEQIRSEEPPPLDQLDPAIPPKLAAVVARAMRKDPAERFADLEQMRGHLKEVQRELTEEARRLSARVRDQRGQLLLLRAALAQRMGPSWEDEPVPVIDERARLATVHALEGDFSARIEALRARIAQADSLAPALRHATELLQTGQAAEAVAEFEAIVAAMPEHARAREGLEQARGHAEVLRRRQRAAELIQEARAALHDGRPTVCLEMLDAAAEIPAPPDTAEEMASLRADAEAAVAAQEALRLARREAEGARARMEQARRTAQSRSKPQYAPALWNEAEVKSTDAVAALAREAYVDARQDFEAAITMYGRFEEAASEAERREHEAAQQARSQAALGRQRAQAEGAPQYARAQWDAGEAKIEEARAAHAQNAFGRACAIFNEALELYGRAEETAREARERELRSAEESRTQATRARERAQAVGALRYMRGRWDVTEVRLTDAEAAFARHAYAQAARTFDEVAAAYLSLEETAREVRRHEQEVAAQARERTAQAHDAANAQATPRYARDLWEEAEAKSAEAEAALGREAYTEATVAFAQAAAAYRRGEEAAGEARRHEQEVAGQAREQMTQARQAAAAQAVPHCAPELWEEAEAKSAEAEAAFGREAYAEAREGFVAAASAYRRGEEAAREARRHEQEAARQAREQTAQARGAAATQAAQQYAGGLWEEAEAKSVEGEAAFGREAYAEARQSFVAAAVVYRRAEEAAREARRHEQEAAGQAREQMAQARGAANVQAARQHARGVWEEAEATSAEAEAALGREAYTEASRAFAAAVAAYRRAEAAAGEARRRQREEIEETRALMVERSGSAATQPELDGPTVIADSRALLAQSSVERADAPTQRIEATRLLGPATGGEAPAVLDRPPTAVADARDSSAEAMPPQWPLQTYDSRATEATEAELRPGVRGSRWRSRRVVMAVVGGLAAIGLGLSLWLSRSPLTDRTAGPEPQKAQTASSSPTAVPIAPNDGQRVPQRGPAESAGGQAAPSSTERAPVPSLPPRAPRTSPPLTPRQALHEAFEGRDPARSVTATVVKDAVRIGRDNLGFTIASSRPGYLYVMVVRGDGSDVELLLPNAVEENNHIEAGQPLKLPGPRWPLKAQGPPGKNEFLAIVSDEPRDFSALSPAPERLFKRFHLGAGRRDLAPSESSPLLAGAAACASATRCSESYGAVVFSIDTVAPEPDAPHVARRPPSVPTPPSRPRPVTSPTSPRCSDLLERASLGEPLTDQEQAILTRDCR